MTSTLERRSESRTQQPPSAQPPTQAKLRIGAISPEGVLTLGGSFLGALTLTWIIYERLLPLSGAFGFWICVAAVTVLFYAVASWATFDGRHVTDRISRLIFIGAGLLVLGVVLDVIGYTTYRGSAAIVHGNFWTQTMAHTGPLQPLTSGGMIHALIGSLEQLGLATTFSVPLGLATALYLVEINDKLAKIVRTITEAMTALPEIIAGLFVYAFIILELGVPASGFAASLALTVMMIPVVTRTSEVILRLVPGTLREASYALGAGQASTALRVILPTARSGLATAVILAMARAVGETAPVLLTAGFSSSINANPFNGAQASLPIYIFTYVRYPQGSEVSRAFGAALALMIMVLILFVLARIIGGKAPGELSTRQRRRIARAPRSVIGDPDVPPIPTGPAFADVPAIDSPGFPPAAMPTIPEPKP